MRPTEPDVPSPVDLKDIGKNSSHVSPDNLERAKHNLHENEFEHLRTSRNLNSLFLYGLALATVALILTVAFLLLFPMWGLFLSAAGKYPHFIVKLDGSVVVAVLTAPLIAIAGLSWATLSAVSGKHLPKVSMRVATGADDSSAD